MPAIKAIETSYAGCRFRSRLEARWAVFMDHLGVPWRYEPEGFELDGEAYLPDFQVWPGDPLEFWLEIKGAAPSPTTDTEYKKAFRLAEKLAIASQKVVVVQWGDVQPPPDLRYLNGDMINFAGQTGNNMWLDNAGWVWDPYGESIPEWQFGIRPTNVRLPKLNKEFHYTPRDGGRFWWWMECRDCGKCFMRLDGLMAFCPLVSNQSDVEFPEFATHTPKLLAAYTAARSARFEYGESG